MPRKNSTRRNSLTKDKSDDTAEDTLGNFNPATWEGEKVEKY